MGQVTRHRRLPSSLQVLADPQLCLSPSSSPRTQPLAYSKQSVLTSPWGCLLDLHRLCARLPRRDLQIILPSAEERPTSVSHPALPLLTEALPPELSRDAYQDWDTRPLSLPPLRTTHLRKHSSSRSLFFLSFSRIPSLYLLLGSLPHPRHPVLGTHLTSAVRDVPTEESLFLSLVQQRWVFKQQERGDQIPPQSREKAKSRGGRHPQSPPSGPETPTVQRWWQRPRRQRLLEVCSPSPGALGAAHLFVRAQHAGAARSRRPSNKGAAIRRRAAARSVGRPAAVVPRAGSSKILRQEVGSLPVVLFGWFCFRSP